MLSALFGPELDMISTIVGFLPFKSVCILSQVNRYCSKSIVDVRETRYDEIIRACPWMSEPRRLQIRKPGPGGVQGRIAYIDGMRWGFGPGEQSLVVRGQGLTFTAPLIPDDNNTVPVVVLPDYEIEVTNEFRVLNDAASNALRDAGIVESLEVNPSCMDLNADVAIACWNGRDNSGWTLSFYAKADTRHLFHIECVLPCYPVLLSRPGQLWIPDAEEMGTVWYFGPRSDRRYRCDIAPHLFPAQNFVWQGNIPAALSALKGHNIDTRFRFGNTLLLSFVQYATHDETFMERVDALLRAGADINAMNDENDTVLAMTVSRGHVRFTAALLERGAVNGAGMLNAVIRQSVMNCSEIVRVLVTHGSDVNESCDLLGRVTPLMLAAESGIPRIVDVLLECGANPMLCDRRGRRAIDYVSLDAGKRRRDDMWTSLGAAMQKWENK